MFDHLSTAELREHIARLKRSMRQPIGMAYSPADNNRDWRELSALERELHARLPVVATPGNDVTNVWH